MKRWAEGKIGREREREGGRGSLTWPELCDAFHGAAFLLCSLSLSFFSLSLFCNLCTNNWFILSMREREPCTRQHKWQQDWALCQTTWLQTHNFIACKCINQSQNISVTNASNAAYSTRYYVFSFHYAINYSQIRLKSCPTFSAPPDSMMSKW